MNIRRYLLMFIVCVSSFMIYTNNVKAEVYTDYKHFTDNYITCSSGYGYCQETLNVLSGHGTKFGDLMFTFLNDPQIMLYGVEVANENWEFYSCDIGTQLLYSDNTTGYTIITAVCPMKINNNGVRAIKFNYDDSYLNQSSFKFTFSDYYSFIVDYNTTDYTSILNSINNSISSLNSNLGGKLDNQKTIINNIYNQLLSTNGKLDFANTKLYDIDSKLNDIKNNASATASNTEEIKNDIKNDSIDDSGTSSSASQWSSKNASNGTITQLLTLPISLLTNITNSINSSCSSFSLGTLFDTELILPCINLNDYLGSALVSIIDILFSGFMIYNIAKKLIKIFNDFTNLKSNQIDEIYGGGNE